MRSLPFLVQSAASAKEEATIGPGISASASSGCYDYLKYSCSVPRSNILNNKTGSTGPGWAATWHELVC